MSDLRYAAQKAEDSLLALGGTGTIDERVNEAVYCYLPYLKQILPLLDEEDRSNLAIGENTSAEAVSRARSLVKLAISILEKWAVEYQKTVDKLKG